MIERISTHILDTTRGVPAAGVPGRLDRRTDDGSWQPVGAGVTDGDGRIGRLNDDAVEPGVFRVTLDTDGHLAAGTFYPVITLTIRLDGARPHYHLPVLAGTFTYSTYLGS